MANKAPALTQTRNSITDPNIPDVDTVIKTNSAIGSIVAAGGWRYAGETSNRDLRLDAIRGIAVLVMLINHLGGEESWLYALTGKDAFFISAAEPFVFISGLVMGIVYGRVIIRQGILAAAKKAAKRTGMLYALTVGVGLAFALVSLQFNLPWAPHWTEDGLGGFVLSIVTLQRAYYLTDILLLYTLLVAAAIPALLLMARGYWWAVLGGSWALWGAWQRWPQRLDLPWHITDNDIFHFAPWQVLFFTALVIGYHRQTVEQFIARAWSTLGSIAHRLKLRKGTPISQEALIPAILVVTGIMVVVSIVLYQWVRYTPSSMDDLTLARLFEKAGVHPGRLVVFVPFMLFAFTWLTIAWKPIKAAVGWLLLPLGQSALPAFTLHLFVAVLVIKAQLLLKTVFPNIGDVGSNAAVSTLLQIAGIALVWGIIVLLNRVNIANKLKTRSSIAKARKPGGRRKLAWAALSASALAAILALTLINREPVTQTLKDLNEKGQHTFVPVVTSTARVPVRASAPSATVTIAVVAQITPTREVEVYEAILPDTGPGVSIGIAPASATIPIPIATTGSEIASITPAPTTNAVEATAVNIDMPTVPPEAAGPIATETPIIPMSAGMEVHGFTSAALGRSMEYIIYLPPDYYQNTDQRYPVVYMLHGMDASAGQWAGFGLLRNADEMMRAGEIRPFIIVLPQGDGSYWFDHANDGPRWGTYLVHDVVGEIDTNYRTIDDRDHRAVGGLSMGAHAALELSINYPETFGIAGAHSPSLHSFDSAPDFFGDEDYFRKHDPASLYAAMPEVARTIKIWIDLGEQDAWLPIVDGFHRQLDRYNIPNEWHVFPGGHINEYWTEHTPDYLRFYSSAFDLGEL